jgi:hypothetical protein
MVKCKLDDWYACVPSGTTCPEGKFNSLEAAEEDMFDFDDEEEE